MTADDWAKAAAGAHDALGDVRSREPLTKSVSAELPGAPDGWYAVFQYKTAFEKAPDTVETFTLKLGHGRRRALDAERSVARGSATTCARTWAMRPCTAPWRNGWRSWDAKD
jgi:hypothetical protein